MKKLSLIIFLAIWFVYLSFYGTEGANTKPLKHDSNGGPSGQSNNAWLAKQSNRRVPAGKGSGGVPLGQGNGNGPPGKVNAGRQHNKRANENRMWPIKNYNNLPDQEKNNETLDKMETEWISNMHAQNLTSDEKKKLKEKVGNLIRIFETDHNTDRSKRQTSTPVVRKEFRRLSPQERTDFAAAYRAMVDSGEFDDLVAMHSSKMSPGAHFGPAFLPWHRRYLRLFEEALQWYSGNSSMALPFWNSGNEYILGQYRDDFYVDSSLFSGDMLGYRNAQGVVDNGLFAYMELTVACRDYSTNNSNDHANYLVTREFEWEPWNFYSPSAGDRFKAYKHHTNLSEPFNGEFEEAHAMVHSVIGGTLGHLDCAPNDILFWLLHCYVDYLWEQNRASRSNGASDYPTDLEILEAHQNNSNQNVNMTYHFGNSEMEPFSSVDAPIYNIDVIADDVSSKYIYEDYESWCTTHADCQGDFWCEPFNMQCVSKIQPGLWMFWDENEEPIVECVHCPNGTTPIATPSEGFWSIGDCV